MYRFNGFTEKANHAMNLAIFGAEELGHTYVGSEHILQGLLKEGSGVAAVVLDELGVYSDELESLLKSEIGTGPKSSLSTTDFTPRTKRVLQNAVMQAANLGHNYVGTEHLLLALIGEMDSYAVRFLNELGANTRDILDKLNEDFGDQTADDTMYGGNMLNDSYPGSGSPGKTGKTKTKTLDQFGKDLTQDGAKRSYRPGNWPPERDRTGYPDFVQTDKK